MRKIFCLLICSLFMSSCSVFKSQEQTFSIDEDVPIEHSYSEIEDYLIEWEDVFFVDLNHYYVYFYSTTCSHCESMKNEIVEEILSRDDIFVVRGSNKVVLKNDVFPTIGAEKLRDFGILGYPSLVEISNGKVTKNVAGKSTILSTLLS